MLKAIFMRRTSMEAPEAAKAVILGRTFCVRIRELNLEMSEEVWI